MPVISAQLVLRYVDVWEGDELLEFFYARLMTGHSFLCLVLYYLYNSKRYWFLNKTKSFMWGLFFFNFPLVSAVDRKFLWKRQKCNSKSFYKLKSGTMADIWDAFCYICICDSRTKHYRQFSPCYVSNISLQQTEESWDSKDPLLLKHGRCFF